MQGLRAGVLEGFRFRPDRERSDGSRGLLAAANRALRELVRERVQRAREGGRRRVRARPRRVSCVARRGVARLVRRREPRSRRTSTCWPTDLLDPPAARARRAAGSPPGSRASCAQALAPLVRAARAGAGGRRARARLRARRGPRRRAAPARSPQQVAALTSDDRRALARLGVTIGRLAAVPARAAEARTMRLRARLYAVRHGQRLERRSGRGSVGAERPRAAAGLLPGLRLPARSGRGRSASTGWSARRRCVPRSRRTGRSSPPRELPGDPRLPRRRARGRALGHGLRREGRPLRAAQASGAPDRVQAFGLSGNARAQRL